MKIIKNFLLFIVRLFIGDVDTIVVDLMDDHSGLKDPRTALSWAYKVCLRHTDRESHRIIAVRLMSNGHRPFSEMDEKTKSHGNEYSLQLGRVLDVLLGTHIPPSVTPPTSAE